MFDGGRWLRTAVLVSIAGIALSTSALATTLDQLTPTERITLGPLVLSNFAVSDDDGLAPAAIDVYPEAFLDAEGRPLIGVRFAGPISLVSGGATPQGMGCTIAFDVAVTDRELALEALTHTILGVADGSGSMSNETVVMPAGVTTIDDGTPHTAQRSCLAGRPCPDFQWTPDVSNLFAPSSSVHVEQTIRISAGDRNDAGSARLEHFEVLFRLAPRR